MEKITKSELDIQEDEKEIEEIQRKIKNNDYNQLKEVHHDKMVLETRAMFLQNKIKSQQLFDECFTTIKNNYDELKAQNKILSENNSILIEIIKEICKSKETSPGLQDKIKNLKV